jgi:hypothetical protein
MIRKMRFGFGHAHQRGIIAADMARGTEEVQPFRQARKSQRAPRPSQRRQSALWRCVRRHPAMDRPTNRDPTTNSTTVMATRFKHSADKRRSRGRVYLLTGFAAIIMLFAWHNSAYLSANWSVAPPAPRASRQRQSLERPRTTALASQGLEQQQWDDGAGSGDDLDQQAGGAAGAGEQQQQQTLEGGNSRGAGGDGTGSAKTYGEAASGTATQQQTQKQRTTQPKQQQRQRPKSKDAFASPLPIQRPAPRAAAQHPTLVLYVYFGTDFEHEERLGYFIRAGIRKDDGVTYRIILAHHGINKVELEGLAVSQEEIVGCSAACHGEGRGRCGGRTTRCRKPLPCSQNIECGSSYVSGLLRCPVGS